MDQVPAPSAVFSMELPEQPKPQQGKMSPALRGIWSHGGWTVLPAMSLWVSSSEKHNLLSPGVCS